MPKTEDLIIKDYSIFDEFKEDIHQQMLSEAKTLDHRKKRTLNTQEFHEKFKGHSTQRERQDAINSERKDQNKKKQEQMKRIKWNQENLCWAMDDTYKYTSRKLGKIWVHNVKDLGSQYLLPPIAGPSTSGKEIADNLRKLFNQFGAPLFFKRDNGPNFCNEEVDKVFAEYGVIALTSPPYYCFFNGSIEQSNYQLKLRINEISEETGCSINDKTIEVLARLAAHEENVKLKRSINRKAPAFMFLGPFRNQYNMKLRKEILAEIKELNNSFLAKIKEPNKKDKARVLRKAIEVILEKQQFITILYPNDCQVFN